MKKLNIQRRPLYDGSENEMPSQFAIEINEKSLTVSNSEVDRHSFGELTNSLSETDFETIAAGVSREKFGGIDLYRIDGMGVYYVIKDEYILIFSFGEFQPGRYKLFFESAWENK